ncbi:hypothetical protein RJ640_027586 [Escallonia rubra]|uniref:VQ domain-containing protein n=1 Tax=Escallonia rubra TaxID=112253 RepID=A0AA88U332_9ASTE|nr:hypothetical protein RJ640_027586 [Escallonia rubra]
MFIDEPATAVTTTVTPTVSHLNPEGRVSKPVRRRSRASRRTPTTLLSTDTTNFRAMVQQFTGGPSAANFNFGVGTRQQVVTPSSARVPTAGYNVQFQQAQQGLYQQQQQLHIFSVSNNTIGSHGSGGGTAGGDDQHGFLQTRGMGESGGLTRAGASSSNEIRREDNYMF